MILVSLYRRTEVILAGKHRTKVFRRDRMAALRLQMGKSQTWLTEKTGIATDVISRYELGNSEPAGENLIKITKALQTSIDYLYGVTDNPLPSGHEAISEIEKRYIEAARRGDIIIDKDRLEKRIAELPKPQRTIIERLIKALAVK